MADHSATVALSLNTNKLQVESTRSLALPQPFAPRGGQHDVFENHQDFFRCLNFLTLVAGYVQRMKSGSLAFTLGSFTNPFS
jgi:hypothetical protein